MFLTWLDDSAFDVADAGLVDRLAELCAERGALLVYKAHYNVAPVDVDGELRVHLPPEADLNAYLGFCDVLVTDYSSGRPGLPPARPSDRLLHAGRAALRLEEEASTSTRSACPGR